MTINVKAMDLNFKTVLATDRGLRAPKMISMNMSFISKGLNGYGFLPAGCLITDDGGGLGKPFPATKPLLAMASGTTILNVRNSYLFKAGDALVVGATAIGTVASVDPDNQTITLAAPSLAPIALSDSLSVSGAATTNILGMVVHVIDLRQSYQVALYRSASVYLKYLPFWNASIAAQFPEIITV